MGPCTEKIELGILIEEVSPRSTNIQSERVAFYLTLSARFFVYKGGKVDYNTVWNITSKHGARSSVLGEGGRLHPAAGEQQQAGGVLNPPSPRSVHFSLP